MNKTIELLSTAGLRKTEMRTSVLQIFVETNHALSHQEIENNLQNVDRVTLYRTLKSFDQKGIIHKVMDGSGVDKYALCEHHCDEGHHHDNHIHFSCNQCGFTYCVDNAEMPDIKLPSGYLVVETNILINGVCNNCRQ